MEDLPLDVLLQALAYLSPPDVVAVSSASRSLRGALWGSPHADTALWRRLAQRHGAAPGPLPHHAASWAAHLRDDLFTRLTAAPLRGRASVYNHGYVCVAHGAELTRGGFAVDIHERGDGRLGDVQSWRSSSLAVRMVFGPRRTEPGHPHPGVYTPPPRQGPPLRVTGGEMTVDAPLEVGGWVRFALPAHVLLAAGDHLYGPLGAGAATAGSSGSGGGGGAMPPEWHPRNRVDFCFWYGESGYGECVVMSVDRASLAARQAEHLLLGLGPGRDARVVAAQRAAAAWTGPP